jgi:lipoprotein-releasing system ATP-binding protein
MVGLTDRADFPVKLLSGGEKQRVAIARSLCNDPDLILADEPSGNLDQENASAVVSLLVSLVKKKKKSLILVTHDFHFANTCDSQYTLAQGKLILT